MKELKWYSFKRGDVLAPRIGGRDTVTTQLGGDPHGKLSKELSKFEDRFIEGCLLRSNDWISSLPKNALAQIIGQGLMLWINATWRRSIQRH